MRFIRKSKSKNENELRLGSPREEFERFVSRRIKALEKMGETAEADLVLSALEIGRKQLSQAPGGFGGNGQAQE